MLVPAFGLILSGLLLCSGAADAQDHIGGDGGAGGTTDGSAAGTGGVGGSAGDGNAAGNGGAGGSGGVTLNATGVTGAGTYGGGGGTFSGPGQGSGSGGNGYYGHGGGGGAMSGGGGAFSSGNVFGGGGGGGGGAGQTQTVNGIGITVSGTSQGGNGGAGGDGPYNGTAGGGGGGGNGVSATSGVVVDIAVTSTGLVQGGNGGAGGSTAEAGGAGGGGGGNGIAAADGGSISNAGTIRGGSGRAAGASNDGGGRGSPGGGGAGIVGANLTIVNSGAISGGLSGDGSTRADAITLGSGASSLTSNTGASYTGAISVASGGSLALLQTAGAGATGSFTYSNVFIGAGALIVSTDSGNSVALSGTNTYSGGTFVNAGTLTLNHQTGGVIDAAGTGGISFTGTAGTLRTDLTATLSNSITSNSNTTGTIAAATGQTLTFNGILYQHGNLIFGSATDQGTVIWSAPGEVLYGGTLRVAGGTLKAGSSPLGNALGDMTYVAQTTVDAGATLDFSNQDGSINNLHGGGNVTAGTGVVTLVNGGDFSGSIFGLSGLKLASGTLVLSGTNTYTGATIVNGGTLDVEGAIIGTSSVTVNVGGTLTGTGLVDPTVVAISSGGTLAPGNGAAGTSLAIEGNLALQSGAIYLVQVNPSTASFTRVTGTATLGGATVNAVFANGSYVSKTYTILTASGGISGTFGSLVDTNLPSNFRTTLSYDANDAYLNLALYYALPGGLNGNQRAVGNALTNFFNANGGIAAVYGALTPGGLTQASGESGTGSQQTSFNAMSQFMSLLTDPIVQRDGGPGSAGGARGFAEEDHASAHAARKSTDAFAMITKAPPQPFIQRWSVWAAGFGGSQSTSGNATVGSNDTTSRIAETAVGADYLLAPNTLLGFALAGGGTSFGVNGLGSGRSDLFQAGAYLRHADGPAYISAALAYGWQDVTTDRTVTIAGADRLRAEFDANAWSGRLEGGYRFVAPWIGGIGLTPYGAAQFTTLDLPAYAEQVISGSAAFALNYASKSVTDTRSEFGLRTDKAFAAGAGVLTLRGRLAWAHDFNPDRSIAATFQALPGASFVVSGAAQARDSALTSASLEMKWLNGWSAAATFEGEFSNVTRSYAGKGSVRYAW
jgi:uncharacterized protein with beta-barrel porin domain